MLPRGIRVRSQPQLFHIHIQAFSLSLLYLKKHPGQSIRDFFNYYYFLNIHFIVQSGPALAAQSNPEELPGFESTVPQGFSLVPCTDTFNLRDIWGQLCWFLPDLPSWGWDILIEGNWHIPGKIWKQLWCHPITCFCPCGLPWRLRLVSGVANSISETLSRCLPH